jgi:formamidopyrimidine-DNA glycosylase
MPELPEVETIVQELKPIITGKTFQRIQVYWQKTLKVNQKTFQNILSNSTIQHINRRGKYIHFTLDTDWRLIIHLGMSGKLLFQLGKKDKKHLRVKFGLTNNLKLYFTDVRKFGRMNIESTNKSLLPNLGPEPLNPETILKVLEKLNTQRTIKSILLDQHILAGLGNIYADEALFRANIHPNTPKSNINQKTLFKLSKEIPQVLKEAIRNKGTTISDYNLPDLIKGKNQFFLRVYGRTHQPCPICKNPIHRIRISGRSSHFCPGCQPEIKQ